jgi:hypothetical protein
MNKYTLYVILLLLVIVWFSFPASAQELLDTPSIKTAGKIKGGL